MTIDTTAMQELINDLNRFKESYLSVANVCGLEIAIEQAERLLSKESEQIDGAFKDGIKWREEHPINQKYPNPLP